MSREVPYLGTINMFSQWRKNAKSLYFKALTISRLLPLTFQFTTSLWYCPEYYISILLTFLDIITAVPIQQNVDSLYFLNRLMCTLLLHCLPSKIQVENVDGRGFGLSVCKLHLLASKIKHTDVYHQDINYNCLYLLYYTYNKHCNQ